MESMAKPDLIAAPSLEEAAECLRVVCHPTRLRIIDILLQGEFAVGEIAEMCDVRPNQVSEHLRLMTGRGLLDYERRGRSIYYRVVDSRLPRLLACIREYCMQEGR
jgi:DNA-binding transcriptional ArsR family regulator